jgi:hypothetical protein
MAYAMNITDILNYLDAQGVFAYLLPFLIIFAVVFGIMEKAKILGHNRGVHATIAIAVGLLSLYNDYVTDFFQSIFPYAGIGIAVLLVALILMGLLSSEDTDGKWVKYVWFGIGAIAFVAIIWASFEDMSFLWGRGLGNFSDLVPIILILAALGGLIAWIVGKPGSNTPAAANAPVTL